MSQIELRRRPTVPLSVQILMAALTCACVALALVAFLIYSDWQRAVARAQVAQSEVDRLNGAMRRMDDDLERLKAVFGYGYPEVGGDGAEDPSTLLGAFRADVAAVTEDDQPATIREILAELTSQRQQLRAERDALIAAKSSLEGRLLDAADIWSAKLEIEADARQKAQRELRETISNEFERTESQRRALAAADTERRQLQVELEQIKDLLSRKTQDWERRETALLTTIDHLRGRLSEEQPKSLGSPDGEIAQVDIRGRTVYINRGDDDRLRNGITFRVYDQNDTAQKPKATIRVAETIGPHLARAVIVDDDPRNPILRGDLIESLVWSPGQAEQIAFAGSMDVDGDGQSDWDRIRLMVELAGAEIVAYVNEKGERQGDPLTPSVRYLVVGDSPDPAAARRPEDKERRTEQATTGTALRREARENGVEIISLHRFLEQLGGKANANLGRLGDR